MLSRRVRLALVEASDLSPTVRRLVLEATDGPFEWAAGQYVELRAPDDPNLDLPLSIASASDPNRPGRFELAVVRSANTEALLALGPGAELEARGPEGSFTRIVSPARSALLVGAGTGVAPLRAMLQEEFRGAGDAQVILLFGARSEPDVLWRDEFEALAARAPRFRFEPTLSSPSAGWTGRRGWVQEHLVELGRRLTSEASDERSEWRARRDGGLAHKRAFQAYVCGHDAMVKDCALLLERDLAVPSESIFIEQY
jgi:NAD(P)H-flavin reductase